MGLEATLQAGVKLDPYTDEKTGSMVYSLYGVTQKPTERNVRKGLIFLL